GSSLGPACTAPTRAVEPDVPSSAASSSSLCLPGVRCNRGPLPKRRRTLPPSGLTARPRLQAPLPLLFSRSLALHPPLTYSFRISPRGASRHRLDVFGNPD